jgi:exopolysaccharide production protein ExoQ
MNAFDPSLPRAATTPALPGVLADPPALLVWLIFCPSVTAILLGSFVGSAGAYLFLALWLMLASAYAEQSLRLLRGFGICWVFPCFALLSMFWSQSPTDTLKFGLEYVGTAACAVLAAGMMTPRQLISALMCCLLLTAIMSVLFGKTVADPLTGMTAFVGVFESKNQLGFFVSLMLLGSFALMLDRGQSLAFRLLGLLALGIEAPLFIRTKSGTAEVTAVFAVAVLIGNLPLSRLSRFGRARLIFAAAVTLLPAVALVGLAGDVVKDFIVNVMGKDTTLTGRTVLWQHAATLIPHHPILGHGFQAFWRHDDVEAESLWYEFHVQSRQGFHFHSTYVETAIELGYLGASILVATLLSVTAALLRWSWRFSSSTTSFFFALLVCLLIRSFVEVDMVFQFQIGSFLLFVSAAYARSQPQLRGARP